MSLSAPTAQPDRSSRPSRSAPRAVDGLKNGPFLIAAGILVVSGIAWHVLDFGASKKPVPWPAGVEVTPDDCRLLTLPRQMGPFELEQDIVLKEDVLEPLGVGSSLDRMRAKDRRSNWYVTRIYQDRRLKNQASPYRYWQLDVTYYTGSADTVPHVPENCLIAGGATQITPGSIVFRVPSAPAPWDGDLKVNKSSYIVSRGGSVIQSQGVEYYLFSVNGQPSDSRFVVRATLSNPWLKYGYFAKIQFRPIPLDSAGITDLAEADRRAKDFFNYVLPFVLTQLPMPSDIHSLEIAVSPDSKRTE